MDKIKKIIPLLIFFASCFDRSHTIKVSPLFSDGMVIQRNAMVDIWGTALPNTDIEILSEWGQRVTVKSNFIGDWSAKLSTPDAGGPFSLKINSNKESFLIKDVLVGEVWLASGQSNMEMSMLGYPPNDTIINYKKKIRDANYPFIRMFNVEKQFSIDPAKDFKGSWLKALPQQIEKFSGTAYFFALAVHKKLDIPIGIIHSSWGGSPCESWTSEEKLFELGMFEETLKEMNHNVPEKDIDKWFELFTAIDIPKQKDQNSRLEKEYEELDFSDNQFYQVDYDDTKWPEVRLPGRFDSLISMDFNGVVWLRKEIFIENVEVDYTLHIGYIDDMDKTYINGNYIGGMNGLGYWNNKREYILSQSYLNKGKNKIAIRAIDTGGPGRFEGVMNISNNIGDTIPIEGLWKFSPVAEIYENKIYLYSQEISIEDRPSFLNYNPRMPTVLFNSMIYPLIPYTIKGVIWYQGESNVGRHKQYNKLFPGMIKDWRSRWQYDFPFYFVQIAPYHYTDEINNHQSQFLRDSQRKALDQINTGMVVTLDIGDFENIHPANKQEVGNRLARLALVNEYGANLNPLGPVLTSSSSIKGIAELEFEHVGSGLILNQSKPNQFEIAGDDLIFYKAKTFVESHKLILFSENVTQPKYVRYAWSDTPHATLFNSENHPASSFMLELK